MQKLRPVNLNLFKIRFPITAISSILHRLSGVILFFFVAFLLYVLQLSLKSEESFTALQTLMHSAWVRFFVWVFLSSLVFHLIAGIRHLIMDCGYGEEKASGKFGAYLVIFLSVVLIIALGVHLW